MNYQAAIDYLYQLGHETLAMKFGLQNTQILLDAFGNPQNSFLKIQVAGTNGKGSVCAFLGAICRSANVNFGLYTSPHLISITERIKINNLEISETGFARLTKQVSLTAQNLVTNQKLEALPTFFEHLTVIALLAFRKANVKVAILETGLGGRLDATTAAAAEIVGISPISFDHQEYLGESLTQIAAEKAAIIHSAARAVIAPQKPEVLQEILRQCAKVSVVPQIESCHFEINQITDDGRYNATFTTPKNVYPNVRLSLRGQHQLENAALAIVLAENLPAFNIDISPEAIIQGLETAVHAGRLEVWTEEKPQILFDGAHNVAGAAALRNYLKDFVKKPVTIVFSAMRDKDLREIAESLFPVADKLILTRATSLRAAIPADLLKLASKSISSDKIFVIPEVEKALQQARALTSPDGVICLTGSLYLIGEAQNLIRPR